MIIQKMELIKNLNWRYATKKFDPSRKVPLGDIEKIKQCIQLSASSYGLQLYRVLIIESKELREKLKPVAWGQDQITDASHLIVFCNYTKIEESDIVKLLERTAISRKTLPKEFKGYGDFILEKLSEKSGPEKSAWLRCQTYIALANLLSACAELKIDACPMEGFEPEKFNEILQLNTSNLNASVITTIGYRHEDDVNQFLPKVRRPQEELFQILG